MYTLKKEAPDDAWEVEALYDLCFAPGRTALSSYRLRDEVPPVADLGRVARDEGGFLGGAIRYWPVRIGTTSVLDLSGVRLGAWLAMGPTSTGALPSGRVR